MTLSTRERGWLAVHQKGSKELIQRLDNKHANNQEYQDFKKREGLGNISSVKQVSKSQVDKVKQKAREALSLKAHGATKGTRMGSAEGTGETLRDTIAPLSRDQHSAVKAAEREAKAAEKPAKPAAAPKKAPKPKKAAPEKKKPTALELIAAAAAKRKINTPPVSPKALRRIAAVGNMEHDHGGFDDMAGTDYENMSDRHRSMDEAKDNREYDYEGDMAMSQLKSIITNAQKLHDMLEPDTNLPEWVQSKITLAEDYVVTAANYMEGEMNEEVEQVDEGMLDDYIEGKITKHHATKHNPEINAARADAAEVTKKIKPFSKKIAQIKKRVSYKNRTHKNYAKTRADLKDAAASIQPLNAELSKHYDRIRDARNKRDSNADSDVDTYHKWGIVGLGVKKLKQKLTKEEVEVNEMDNRSASNDRRERRDNTPEAIAKRREELKKELQNISPYVRNRLRLPKPGEIDEGKQGVTTKTLQGTPVVSLTDISKPSDFTKDKYGRTVPKKLGASDPRVKFHKEEVEQIDEQGVTISHDRFERVHGKKARDTGSASWAFTNKRYGDVDFNNEDEFHQAKGSLSDAKKSAAAWARKHGHSTAYIMSEEIEQVDEAKKHRMGGALFADTAARLQKAVNAHKERMDKMTNGPESTYHHPTLNITTKSRLTYPAPWVKVEDK